MALPCFRREYAVASTLEMRRGEGRLLASTEIIRKFANLYGRKEQALDVLAVDPRTLEPKLGAEIEWSANMGYRVQENEETLKRVWGEPAPAYGYLAEVLYGQAYPPISRFTLSCVGFLD